MMSLELLTTLTPPHGVRRLEHVKQQRLKFQRLAVKTSHWPTIQVHHHRVMPQ